MGNLCGVVVGALLGLTAQVGVEAGTLPGPKKTPGYIGSDACRGCHPKAYDAWAASDHAHAMQPATVKTVRGDFNNARLDYGGAIHRFFRRNNDFWVKTTGPRGAPAEYRVLHTFGRDPLQQYLVAFPDGRLQALPFAYDTRPLAAGGQRWFHVQASQGVIKVGDPLHWTGRLMNWNNMCATCHSTALEKNYDAASHGFDTRWSEETLGCESCHGPGVGHVARYKAGALQAGALKDSLIDFLGDRTKGRWVRAGGEPTAHYEGDARRRPELEVCAACHARRAMLVNVWHPQQPFLDQFTPTFLDVSAYYPDGQIDEENYEYASFLQSRMAANGVTCGDCHAPHTNKLRLAGNAVCGQCHDAAVFDAPAHHHHAVGGAGAQCAVCHMPARTYMGNDLRHDHSFRIPRPDLNAKTDSPDACTNCHQDKNPPWAAAAIRGWGGTSMKAAHYGAALAAARKGMPGATAALAALLKDHRLPGIVRGSAAVHLIFLPDGGRAAPELINSSHDRDPMVRLGAARAATLLDPAQRAKAFAPLLGDRYRAVRQEAAAALAGDAEPYLAAADKARLEAAIADVERTMAVNGDLPESHYNVGNLRARRGDAAAAGAAYERALRRDPSFVAAYVNLADLNGMAGDDAGAVAVLRKGLAQAPDAAALHHALGLALVRQGSRRAATDQLYQATKLAPEVARYAYIYAVALASSGQLQAAITTLKSALARAPHDPDLLFALAGYALQARDIAAAKDALARFVVDWPKDPRAAEAQAILTRL